MRMSPTRNFDLLVRVIYSVCVHYSEKNLFFRELVGGGMVQKNLRQDTCAHFLLLGIEFRLVL